jgi:hypothetical protein
MDLNIMMDAAPLYPEPYHPSTIDWKRDMSGSAKPLTRTQRPVKYYLVDFGISRRYNAEDGVPLEEQIFGGDKTVPEFQNSSEPCNPFPTDVYYLGNMIRKDFLQVRCMKYMPIRFNNLTRGVSLQAVNQVPSS